MAGVDEFFERVAALRREGAAFAIATVVSRRAPVSSHMGDRAIVFGDGRKSHGGEGQVAGRRRGWRQIYRHSGRR